MDILLKVLATRAIPWLLICSAFAFGFHSTANAETTAPTFTWRYGGQSTSDPTTYPTGPNALTAGCVNTGRSGAHGFWSGNTYPSQSAICQNTNGSYSSPTINMTATGSASCPSDPERPWTLVTGPAVGTTYCERADLPPPDPCEELAGQVALEGNFSDSDRDGELTPITCVNTCQAILSHSGPGGPSCTFGESGVGQCTYTIHGVYKYSGAQCSGTEAPPETTPPDQPDCPQCDCFEQGGSYGTVNGVQTCVPQGTPGSPPVTTQPPPTKETATPPPTPENPNPEPETTVTPAPMITVTPSASPGGEPTVTKETTNPDGSTSVISQPKGAYCEENPNAKICGEGSDDMFGGSCSAGFACDGDVIQCAIAREQHIRNCELFETDSTESQLYEQIKAGTDAGTSDNPANADNRELINLPTTLDNSNGGVTGTLSNVTVAIPGGSLTLSFTQLIPILQFMGYLVLAFSYFRAYKIVGGVK